ncbi:MAG: peptidoglycan DD-metalloendopeptidase family protein [Cytophagales bacterium]|nr:peptidoglycan DD-metalloendopeptidase family protein [Cytophagales bacterium]
MNKRNVFIGGVTLAVSVSLMFFFYKAPAPVVLSEVCIDVDDPILVYGFNVDTLSVSVGVVQTNESLSGILDEYSVGYPTIHTLVQNAKDVYNVRRLRAGDDYLVIHTKGEKKRAQQFIIEPNAREYIIYHLSDSIYAERVQRKVEVHEKEVAGEIKSSVYMAAVNNGGSPQLVSRLVDVFAWQIDFFTVQKGDKFKVIFEEEMVDGQPIGMKRILAAYFEHYGKPNYAIYFDECGGRDYYDECGGSVRRAFLKAPLNYARISSRYSLKRFHPVLKRYKSHLGTDYAAPTGTPIRSVGNGVVLEAQYKGGNGNYVKVRHNSTYTTQYLHMSKIAKGIYPGATVGQGQTIGFVGSTGLATGPHLCFRFWKNGRQVDALKVDLPPAKPIDPSELTEFVDVRDEMMIRLDAIAIQADNTLLANAEL